MFRLKGEFWTDKNEMIEDIEKIGYEILELNDEYIVVEDGEEKQWVYDIITAGSTITINM